MAVSRRAASRLRATSQFALPKSFRFENEFVIVRSFRDSRFFLESLNDARDFGQQRAARGSAALDRAMQYLETGVLSSEWDVVALLGEDFSDGEQNACSCDEHASRTPLRRRTPSRRRTASSQVLLYKYYDVCATLTARCWQLT